MNRTDAHAPASVIVYEVGTNNLSKVVCNPDHYYYMIVINDSKHWVGTNSGTVSDSFDPGPHPPISNSKA